MPSELFFDVSSIDYPILDADAHVVEPPDLWQSRLPTRLREKGPQLLHIESGDVVSFDGGNRTRHVSLSATAGLSYLDFSSTGATYDSIRQGAFEPKARLTDLDVDGIYAQVIYPTLTLEGVQVYGQDPELQRACVRAYNEWIHEFCEGSGGRLIPVAIMPSTGIDDAVQELTWAVEHGFRSLLIGSFPNGSGASDPSDDRLWGLLEESGIPIAIHIGSFLEEGRVERTVRDAPAIAAAMTGSRSGRDAMSVATMFIFAGVFSRFPRLQLALVESNIGWIPTVMEQVDNVFLRTRFLAGLAERMRETPSQIFHRNFWATFMVDHVGVRNRDLLNAAHVMWSTDYPHSSTDWPNSRVTIERNFRGLPKDEVRRFLFDNCKNFYKLDYLPEVLPLERPPELLA